MGEDHLREKRQTGEGRPRQGTPGALQLPAALRKQVTHLMHTTTSVVSGYEALMPDPTLDETFPGHLM
ncbi:MAG: hypothetical protein MZU79_01160 [Anaerotruncus sp.]|nr:hypothetical protein [Anaerotruncus sp.]